MLYIDRCDLIPLTREVALQDSIKNFIEGELVEVCVKDSPVRMLCWRPHVYEDKQVYYTHLTLFTGLYVDVDNDAHRGFLRFSSGEWMLYMDVGGKQTPECIRRDYAMTTHTYTLEDALYLHQAILQHDDVCSGLFKAHHPFCTAANHKLKFNTAVLLSGDVLMHASCYHAFRQQGNDLGHLCIDGSAIDLQSPLFSLPFE